MREMDLYACGGKPVRAWASSLATDCRHFPGDRPCGFHKEDGRTCDGCGDYAPVKERVLIVKLDAMGDVLRTTAILPPLVARHQHVAVVWLTRTESVPLLANNPFVHEVWPLSPVSVARVFVEDFALVLGLDPAKEAAALTAMARGRAKRGFGLGPDGQVRPLQQAAERWFRMGAFDQLKKANAETYQRHIARICGLSGSGLRIVLRLSAEERRWAEAERVRLGLGQRRPLIGVNLGGGGRWQRKQWSHHHLRAFLRMAEAERGGRALLLGGERERELMDALAAEHPAYAVPTDTAGDVRRLFALLDLCEVVVTGDTLALHAAVGLGVPVVAVFGPTSAAEIDLQGNGVKIVPDLDCLCCYQTRCDRAPSCMDLITPAQVLAAMTELLAATPVLARSA
jgi:heptosyltransferase-2